MNIVKHSIALVSSKYFNISFVIGKSITHVNIYRIKIYIIYP
jgi:hypothetical protein